MSDPKQFKTKPKLCKVIFFFLHLSYRRSGKKTGCKYCLLDLAFEKVMEEALDLFFSKPEDKARVACNWEKKFIMPVFYKEKAK